MTTGDGCLHPQFRKPSLTVDGVVLVRQPRRAAPAAPRVLLIERGTEPFRGHWALPGGFVEYGEDIADAIHREIAEETGLSSLPFRQFFTFGSPDRDPRGHTVSVVYVAELVGEPPPVSAGDDAAEARWFAVDDLPPLAFDHEIILQRLLCALEIG